MACARTERLWRAGIGALLSAGILGACGSDKPTDLPADWTLTRVADCCTLHTPPSVIAEPVRRDALEAPAARLVGPGLEITVEVQPREFDVTAPAVRGPEPRENYSDSALSVDGQSGRLIRYRSDRPGFQTGETLNVLLAVPGQTSARQLRMTVHCRTSADCTQADTAIRSLKFETSD